ncbi:hypothetical protein [Streptomyces sp. NPDC002491]
MTEYTAECRISSFDTMRARIDDGEDVSIDAVKRGDVTMNVFLRPDDARTFARGIIALADEIDGGEAAEAEPTRAPQAGDRVRVVRNSPRSTDEHIGECGTLKRVDEFDDRLPYLVDLPTNSYWWCAEVELVDEPETAPVIKVGDKVRVLKDDDLRAGEYVGKTGIVADVYPGERLAYNVQFGDGSGRHGDRDNGYWNVAEVELVDEPADVAEASPARSPFVVHIDEAKRLLDGTDHSGADVVRLAEILAQQ